MDSQPVRAERGNNGCACGGPITEGKYYPVDEVYGRAVVRVTKRCGACGRLRIELRDATSNGFIKLEAGG
jgi:hypothetical protein